MLPFLLKEVVHRLREPWVCEPVQACCARRHQGPRHFVLPLCPTFKTVKTVGDAPNQWLVVASLEVQAIDGLQTAPVAAIGHTVVCFCIKLPATSCQWVIDCY